MATTLFDASQRQLDQILTDFKQLKDDSERSEEAYADLGRMMVAMYDRQTHPTRMFHLLTQFAETKDPQVDVLATLAWILAESQGRKLLTSKKETC